MADPVRRSLNQLARTQYIHTYANTNMSFCIHIPLYARLYIYTWSASSTAQRACFSMFERERECVCSWEISDFHHFEARTCSEHACNKVRFAVGSSDMSQNLHVRDVHQHSLVSQSVSGMMYRYHVFLSTKVRAKDVSIRPQWASWALSLENYNTKIQNPRGELCADGSMVNSY